MERSCLAVIVADHVTDALAAVAGVSVLKRAVLTLCRAKVARMRVIGGADHTALRAALAGDPEILRAGVVVDVGDVTALADAQPGEAVIVVGADHVFEERVIERLLEDDGVRVAVRAGGRCTLAAGGGELIEALRKAGGAVGPALDALAGRGRVQPVDVADLLCEPAGTPAARRTAERALLRSLIKPTDGWVARHLNRRISLVVTRALLGTSITPNQMTLVANALGFLGVVLVARATWWNLLAGAALVQVQSILDGCDGEIARLKFQGSRLGEWLDNVLDDTINIAYGLALGHATAVLLDQPVYRWLGIATAAGYTIYNVVLYAHLALVHGRGNPFLFRWWFQKDDAYLQQSLAGAGVVARLVGAIHAMGRRDLFLLAFLGFAAIRVPQLAVAWYVTVAGVSAILAIVHVAAGGVTARVSAARTPRRGAR